MGRPGTAGFSQKQTYAKLADSDIASAISGISGVSEKPSSAGAKPARVGRSSQPRLPLPPPFSVSKTLTPLTWRLSAVTTLRCQTDAKR